MSDDIKPKIDVEVLEKQAEENPKSKKWNNPNSRKNLKQYKEPVNVELLTEEQKEELEIKDQAEEITRGRKLSPELVESLIPKTRTMKAHERKRFTGIVVTFLSDFKNEEPTASDADDILEIAKCDLMEMRLLEASRDDPGTLVAAGQMLERINKRKQASKENLANRRSDRQGSRSSQDINIVDLVVRYDTHRQTVEQDRISKLLGEEKGMEKTLRDIVEEETF